MKKKQIITATLLLTVTVFIASCGSKTSKNNAENTTTEQQGEEIYSCPMHPEITGKKGDTCSKCGMELTK